jgi:hypothetical protein
LLLMRHVTFALCVYFVIIQQKPYLYEYHRIGSPFRQHHITRDLSRPLIFCREDNRIMNPSNPIHTRHAFALLRAYWQQGFSVWTEILVKSVL